MTEDYEIILTGCGQACHKQTTTLLLGWQYFYQPLVRMHGALPEVNKKYKLQHFSLLVLFSRSLQCLSPSELFADP